MLLSPVSSIFFRDSMGFTANSQLHAIGTKAQTKDGRVFRWVLVGATTLVPGNLIQAPAQVTTQVNLAVNTALATLGSTALTITPGANIVANFYAGGLVQVSNGAGLGYTYTIASHPAGNSTTNVIVQLDRSESLAVAANSVTRVDLLAPVYGGVIANPTVPTSIPVGVAVSAIVNGQYGWVQTHGPVGVLIDGVPAVGTPVGPSAAVAGAVSVQTGNATMSLLPSVGYMLQTGVSTAVKQVFLTID
jgi:hypothetical protein